MALVEGPVFYINGKLAKGAPHSNLSLNEYIRQHTPYKGTKLACGEGGCGACAVQVTRYNPQEDTYNTSSVNSCLCPVGSLDGELITTVEGLGNGSAGFSKVQEAFARNHASQCGFCTPGFVVACHATLAKAAENGSQPTSENMMQGLDGNLCRCTGYTTILDACKGLTADMEDLCCQSPSKPVFPEELKEYARQKAQRDAACSVPESRDEDGTLWVKPHTVKEIFHSLQKYKEKAPLILAGNTAAGVYHEWPQSAVIISLKGVPQLKRVSRSEVGLEFGAALPFAEIIAELRKSVDGNPAPEPYLRMAAHIERVAGSHVRWAATPGGNLSLLINPKYYLESDFATVLAGAGGKVEVTSNDGKPPVWYEMDKFCSGNLSSSLGSTALITGVSFPAASQGYQFWSHKVALRYYNSHALVNLAISYIGSKDGVSNLKIAAGCPTLFREGAGCEAKVAWQLRRAFKAEHCINSFPLGIETLAEALHAFQQDICPGNNVDASASWYRSTLEGLLFQGLSPLLPELDLSGKDASKLLVAPSLPPPSVPHSRQKYQHPPKSQQPVGLPVEKDRIHLQASGEAVYSSDVGVGNNQLYARVVASTEALANIDSIDPSKALEMPGVVAFVGPEDIPGENKVGLGGMDAEIFASKKTEYLHQPLGLILAESPVLAEKAAKLVEVSYSHPKENGQPILSIQAAVESESYYEIPEGAGGQIHRGNVPKAMAAATHVIKNARYTLPSQQHFYMETQAAVAEPQEGGAYTIHSSTQTLDGVQSAAARALGISAHNITAVCRRAGGGFGGKVARSLPVAAAAAVAARKTGRTVHYQLSRNEDFRMNGGRSETEVEYVVGFDNEGRISALSVRGWWLAGADLDLAWNDMMIIQTGADQVYDIPNIDLDLKVVRTNLPPRTIMRGPGFMDAAMVIEQVLEHVVNYLGSDPESTRRLNFLKAPNEISREAVQGAQEPLRSLGDLIRQGIAGVCARALPLSLQQRRIAEADPTMMKTSLSKPFKVEQWTLPRIWEGLIKQSDYMARRKAVEEYNEQNFWRKRGISINPCRFDSAPQPIVAQVNIYYDGSILLTHGGLEVGQGLSTKVKQMAVYELSKLLPEELRPLPLSLIKINDSRSDIVPNAGPTWSSTGSEASCAAVQKACQQLVKNLRDAAKDVKAETATGFWSAAVAKVHPGVGFAPATAQLSAIGFFDGSETGGKDPMSYSSFGAAVSEVEIDVLTGEKLVLQSDIHFDCGRSLNPAVDMGQVEGAFIQGLGYLTSEEVVYDRETGKLISDGTWTYKIPSAACIPQKMNVEFLKDSPNPKGVMSSKASGEPSLLLSTSVLYALRHAIVAARKGLQAIDIHGLLQEQEAFASSIDSTGLSTAECSKGGNSFFVLAAPATTIKIKQACGSFSIADILDKAALSEAESTDSGSWEKL